MQAPNGKEVADATESRTCARFGCGRTRAHRRWCCRRRRQRQFTRFVERQDGDDFVDNDHAVEFAPLPARRNERLDHRTVDAAAARLEGAAAVLR